MFLTERILNLVVKAKDDAHALAIAASTDACSLVVTAERATHSLSLASLQNEISALKRAAEKLEEQLKYEHARADSLVDRLLVRDARVAAVAPAAVAAAVWKDEQAVKKLSEIFDSVNAMGAEVPAREHRAFDMAGGSAVAPR